MFPIIYLSLVKQSEYLCVSVQGFFTEGFSMSVIFFPGVKKKSLSVIDINILLHSINVGKCNCFLCCVFTLLDRSENNKNPTQTRMLP